MNQIKEELIPYSLTFLSAEFPTNAVVRNLIAVAFTRITMHCKKSYPSLSNSVAVYCLNNGNTSVSLNTVIKMLLLLLLLS